MRSHPPPFYPPIVQDLGSEWARILGAHRARYDLRQLYASSGDSRLGPRRTGRRAGLMVHTALAMTAARVPWGIVSQKFGHATPPAKRRHRRAIKPPNNHGQNESTTGIDEGLAHHLSGMVLAMRVVIRPMSGAQEASVKTLTGRISLRNNRYRICLLPPH